MKSDLNAKIFHDIFQNYPSPVFITNRNVEIIYWNNEAEKVSNTKNGLLKVRGGEALYCINVDSKHRCGEAEACKKCLIRNSVNNAIQGKSTVRIKAKLELKKPDGGKRNFYALVTTSPIFSEAEVLVLLVIEDINEIVEINELIPICAWCKKIWNDKDYWDSVEKYLNSHLDLSFSHGICPDCFEKLKNKIETS